MNMSDKISEEASVVKGWILTRWHSFSGGIVIGAVAMWVLVKLGIL